MAISDPTAARTWDAVPLPAMEPEIPTRLTMLASCQRVVEWIAAPTKPAMWVLVILPAICPITYRPS